MKKISLILMIFTVLILCCKTREKNDSLSNRFRMKKFTKKDIPKFKFLRKTSVFERKDERIRSVLNNRLNPYSAVYIKNSFIYFTGYFPEGITKTKKFDFIVKNKKVKLIKISEWKQTKIEKRIENNFFKELELINKKFLSYFLKITDKKIAKLIPKGVAIRFHKKLDFNRDGKKDHFVIVSYPYDWSNEHNYKKIYIYEKIYMYVILSNKNGYSLGMKSYLGSSLLASIIDVKILKNKFLFIIILASGGGYFETVWYE